MKKKMLIAVLIGVFSLSVGCSGVSEGIKQGYEDAMNEETVEEEKVEEKTEEVKEETEQPVEEEQTIEESKEELSEEEYWENHHRENIKTVPEANTSAMVEYQVSKAKVDIIDLSKEERTELVNKAYDFIQSKVVSSTYFESNDTMEKLIYYGTFLENNYKEERENNELAKVVADIGTDTIQLVKYVYRGQESKESESVTSNHDQIIKGINKANEIIKEIN